MNTDQLLNSDVIIIDTEKDKLLSISKQNNEIYEKLRNFIDTIDKLEDNINKRIQDKLTELDMLTVNLDDNNKIMNQIFTLVLY